MITLFRVVSKEKARKMIKENKTNAVFDITVGDFIYKLTVNIHNMTKHKTLSYNVECETNSHKENCILLCF